MAHLELSTIKCQHLIADTPCNLFTTDLNWSVFRCFPPSKHPIIFYFFHYWKTNLSFFVAPEVQCSCWRHRVCFPGTSLEVATVPGFLKTGMKFGCTRNKTKQNKRNDKENPCRNGGCWNNLTNYQYSLGFPIRCPLIPKILMWKFGKLKRINMVRAPFLFIFRGIFTITKHPFSKDFCIKVKINLRSAEIWDYAGQAE